MTTSEQLIFGRVITAMVTPFGEDGAVNFEVAEKLADYLITHGSDSILVCGTTGESPTLSWQEEFELFQVVKKAVTGRGKVIAGTGSNSTQEAIAATQKAAKIGLDGTLQVVPYYNKPPQSGLYQHFEAVAKACPDLPIVLYNIPGRTGRNLEPETVARLANIDNIVAIKEASGSLQQACQIRLGTPDSFAIYSGEDDLTLPLLSVGGAGVISVASHLVGEELQQMITAFSAGQVNLAKDIHLKLYPLFKALFWTTNPLPVKATLELQGWNVGNPRLPLGEIPTDLKEKLANLLKKMNLV
jgi:4-hydroxy-tetrahydrodipicolinate synthase